MKHIAVLAGLIALASPFLASAPAAAQTVQSGAKPNRAASHLAPMHPHQLTLYPHGKPERRQPAYSYHRHRFDQPTATHNTFMGPRYY